MTEEQALVAAIRADPNDNTLRLAFADWLDEHDQPERAAWVRDVEIFWWMGPEYTSPLPQILQQLRHEDPTERDKAGPVVERLRAAAAPMLHEAFAAGNWDLRRSIAEIFSWIRDGIPRPLPELIADMGSNHDDVVRMAMVELRWHGSAAAPAVHALIRDWERWVGQNVRSAGAEDLGRLIVNVLEQIGRPALEAVPFLVTGLGRNYLLAEAVSRAIMAMGLLSAMPELERLLRHSSDWVRFNAAAVLVHASWHSSEAVSVLSGLRHHTDTSLARAARDLLRAYGRVDR
jgi:uncharacterized protein (TIGR02996 family)